MYLRGVDFFISPLAYSDLFSLVRLSPFRCICRSAKMSAYLCVCNFVYGHYYLKNISHVCLSICWCAIDECYVFKPFVVILHFQYNLFCLFLSPVLHIPIVFRPRVHRFLFSFAASLHSGRPPLPDRLQTFQTICRLLGIVCYLSAYILCLFLF